MLFISKTTYLLPPPKTEIRKEMSIAFWLEFSSQNNIHITSKVINKILRLKN